MPATQTQQDSGRLTDGQVEAFKRRLGELLEDGQQDKGELAGRVGYKDEDEMRRALAPSSYVARSKYEALEDYLGASLTDEEQDRRDFDARKGGKKSNGAKAQAQAQGQDRRASDRMVGQLREAYDCLVHAREIVEGLGMKAMAEDIGETEAEVRGAVLFAEHASRRSQ